MPHIPSLGHKMLAVVCARIGTCVLQSAPKNQKQREGQLLKRRTLLRDAESTRCHCFSTLVLFCFKFPYLAAYGTQRSFPSISLRSRDPPRR